MTKQELEIKRLAFQQDLQELYRKHNATLYTDYNNRFTTICFFGEIYPAISSEQITRSINNLGLHTVKFYELDKY